MLTQPSSFFLYIYICCSYFLGTGCRRISQIYEGAEIPLGVFMIPLQLKLYLRGLGWRVCDNTKWAEQFHHLGLLLQWKNVTGSHFAMR
jgi:hypothetical protein